MTNMIRKHSHKIRLDKAERTSQGYLRVPARLTRTGVLKYVTKDGVVVRELRHPEDVFNPESYKQLAGVPLTNDHPKKGLLDTKNTKDLVIGWVGDEVEPKDIYLQAVVTIVDDEAISDVENGKQELSCGYTAELVPEQGIYNGEPYDVRQKNIQYNHLSLVKKGRAGENVRLLMDSDDVEFEGVYEPIEEDSKMQKFKIGDKEYEVSPELHGALQDMMSQNDAKVKEMNDKMAVMVPKDKGAGDGDGNNPAIKDAQKKVEAAEAKADALQAEIAELKKTRTDSTDTNFQKAVAARVKLEKVASLVIKEPKFDGKSDIELMKEVIVAKFPKTELADKSETYVQVRYDMAAELIAEEGVSLEALKAKHEVRKDGGGAETPDPDKARQRSWEADQKAWQRKESH
jgi:uncharacterized protein